MSIRQKTAVAFLALLTGGLALASEQTELSGDVRTTSACSKGIATSDSWPPLDGAVIGDIILDRQQVFNTTLPEENKRLYRLANRYHILTRPSTIRSQLLFKPGDPYSRRVLDESERILRQSAYLFDAWIQPVRYTDGVVDVCVTTRDLWTLSPDISFTRSGGENESYFGLEELSIAGTGAAIGVTHSSDVDRDSTSIRFRDPQVGRSRVTFGLSLAHNSDGDGQELIVERPFFALDARWSAGGQLSNVDRIDSLYALGNAITEYRHDRRYAQAHYGWSTGLKGRWVKRWSIGAVFDQNRFTTPPASALPGPVPADRKLIYPFVSYEVLEDKFTKTRNRDQIGRTEDFYLGSRFAGSVGLSDRGIGADRAALIFRFDASTGFSSSSKSMLLVGSRLTGRHENNTVKNRIWHASARYYLNQSEKRLLFATLSVDFGDDLDLDNLINLGGDSGLRGYPLRYQTGESRALLKIEQRYFSDWYPFRLARVGAAVFADLGRTWGTSPVGSPQLGWLKDAGIGLRLAPTRNSSGKTLHIDLAFPFDGDPTIDNLQLIIESRRGF